jgi:hypothetical protein
MRISLICITVRRYLDLKNFFILTWVPTNPLTRLLFSGYHWLIYSDCFTIFSTPLTLRQTNLREIILTKKIRPFILNRGFWLS